MMQLMNDLCACIIGGLPMLQKEDSTQKVYMHRLPHMGQKVYTHRLPHVANAKNV